MKSWHREQKRLRHHRTKMAKAAKRQEALSTSYGRMMARRKAR